VQTIIDHEEDQVGLPATMRDKGYQTHVASAANDRSSTVLTNFLSIDQRPATLFVYEITFTREYDANDNNKAVLVTKRFDKEGLFEALRQRSRYRRLAELDNWVTDGTNIWSTVPLFNDANFTMVPGDEARLVGTNSNSCRTITAVLASVTYKCVINLQKSIGQLYGDSKGRVKGDDESALLQRGLNAMISKYATDAAVRQGTQTLQSGANKFYNTSTRPAQLSQYVKAFHGFFISVLPGAQQLFVNINLRCSSFLIPGLGIQDIVNSCGTLSKADSVLRGLKVKLTGTALAAQNNQHQGIEFITNMRDPNHNNSPNDINVNGKPPRQPRYERSDMMETFGLSPYRQPLSQGETSAMIRSALKLPNRHVQELNQDAITMFGLSDPNTIRRLRDSFGLVVQTTLMKLPCRFLKTPGVLYQGNRTAAISNASWNLVGGIKVSGPCGRRTVQILDLSGLPNQDLVNEFRKALDQSLKSIGIDAHVPDPKPFQTPGPYMSITEGNLRAELQRIVPDLQRSSTSLVIVIPRHSYDLYSVIKRVTDLQLGIQTTCVSAEKLSNIDWDSPNARMHCANIGLKLNLKGDGHNHNIARANIIELYDRVSKKCDTIVIGADVTHPLGHCATACPSAAAVVGSVDDDFAKFPGSMRLQRSKTEVILDLADMVMERLLDWADKHGDTLPDKMLFYRDGVSESQFDAVREKEIPALQEAYDKAYGYLRTKKNEDMRKGIYPFKLTFVVVGKRHNTRFFPTNTNEQLSAKNGNVKPGLVVDQVITHPYIMDFYLQSHQPVQGTGRSAHYFVLQNQMALEPNRLQDVTHAFCYNYARATKGVSYCGPAYYADRLCDRARAYIRDWLIGRPGIRPSRVQGATENIDTYRDFVATGLHNSVWYRPDRTLSPKYGVNRQHKNPWHPNLDNIMFYL
jgi:hypothetical protein